MERPDGQEAAFVDASREGLGDEGLDTIIRSEVPDNSLSSNVARYDERLREPLPTASRIGNISAAAEVMQPDQSRNV